MAHEMTLLSAEVRTLQAANEALSKRRRAKKARVRQGGALTIEDAQDIIAQKDVDKQVRRDIHAAGGSRGEGQPSGRRYRTCGKAGPRTLLSALLPDTPVPLRQRWASQIRETLAELHKAGIVWGDAKAENVLIDRENNAWVTDFGGGYTVGWVDAEKAGTVEGDLQGLERILNLLNRQGNR